MRFIGLLRSEASPSKRATIGCPATTPIISREPVPALPKSSVSTGCRSEPSPEPQTLQFPSAWRTIFAPSWRHACAVRNTSSPSRSPSILVSPIASRPKISARCETDLSPDGRKRPVSGPDLRALSGAAGARAWAAALGIVTFCRAPFNRHRLRIFGDDAQQRRPTVRRPEWTPVGRPKRTPRVGRPETDAPCRAGDWSGRWESNPRHSAWEADVLPLNYARALPV